MKVRIVVEVAVAAVLFVASLLTTVPAQAASGTAYGCQRGYVCMWGENKDFRTNKPVWSKFKYGIYNLHDVYGKHWVMDNQWDYAYVVFYSKYDGQGTCFGFNTNQSGPGVADPYMTPVNSIGLSDYLPSRCEFGG